jgi:hypothetical protein
MGAIHVNTVVPGPGFNVVVLCLFQVALHFQLLGQVLVGVLEEIFAEFGHQADHVVVLFSFFVHVDGKIGLIGTQVHTFCVLEESFSLEFTGFLNIEHGVLRFWEVARDNLIGLVPLVAPHIHLKCLNEFTSIDEVFLSEIKLSDLSIVSSNLLIVRSADFRWLISN